MSFFNELKEKSTKLANTASKKANEALEKGKTKVSVMNLENDLAKAQKQLGALVYLLHKTSETNDELVAQYIEEVASIEAQIEELSKEEIVVNPNVKACPGCSAELAKEAKFCAGCGEKQPEIVEEVACEETCEETCGEACDCTADTACDENCDCTEDK